MNSPGPSAFPRLRTAPATLPPITLPAQARQQPEMIRIQLPRSLPHHRTTRRARSHVPARSAHGTRASAVLSGIAPPAGSSRAAPSGSGPPCFERYRARLSTPAPSAAPAPGTPHPSARSSSRTDAPDSGQSVNFTRSPRNPRTRGTLAIAVPFVCPFGICYDGTPAPSPPDRRFSSRLSAIRSAR